MTEAPEGSGLSFSNEEMLKAAGKANQKSVKRRLKMLLQNPKTEVFQGVWQNYFGLGGDAKTT